jgi:hypothetical protein
MEQTMSDNPNKTQEVDMNSPLIPQRKRIAAGAKLTGQSLSSGADKPKKETPKVKK